MKPARREEACSQSMLFKTLLTYLKLVFCYSVTVEVFLCWISHFGPLVFGLSILTSFGVFDGFSYLALSSIAP